MLTQVSNELGPEGVGALVGALEKMEGLQALNLVNGVGDERSSEGRSGLG